MRTPEEGLLRKHRILQKLQGGELHFPRVLGKDDFSEHRFSSSSPEKDLNKAPMWMGVARAAQEISSFLYLHKDPEALVLAPFLMRKLKLRTLY